MITVIFFNDSAVKGNDMLIFSGKLTKEMIQDESFQEKLNIFAQRTGINVIPHITSSDGEFSLMKSESLDADIRLISSAYNYDYLPSEEDMASLLYPLFLCRWHTTSTHYTKRCGWNSYQLIYTHSGSGILNRNNRIYYLRPDTLCLLDCRPYHYYFAADDGGWEYSFIHFDGPSAKYLYNRIAEKGVVFPNLKHSKIKQQYDALVELSEKNLSDFELQFHLHLTALLIELASFNPATPKLTIPSWLTRIQAYIIENYNQEWSVRDLAELSCLSESRFAHAFKETLGISPIEYRDYLRIEHAKRIFKKHLLFCGTNYGNNGIWHDSRILFRIQPPYRNNTGQIPKAASDRFQTCII